MTPSTESEPLMKSHIEPLIQPVDPRLTIQVDIRPTVEIEAWLADELKHSDVDRLYHILPYGLAVSAGYTNEVTSMPELNVPLLSMAVGFAKGEVETKNQRGQRIVWSQWSWMSGQTIKEGPDSPVCGTTGCIAGWTAVAVGAELLPTPSGPAHQVGSTISADWARLPHHTAMDLPLFAEGQLGLSGYEADLLFQSENKVGDIVLLARLFSFARGLDPDDVCAREEYSGPSDPVPF